MEKETHFLFYGSADGKKLILCGDEVRHAVKALRVSVGSTIAATDGKGAIYHAVVSTSAADRCEADIKEVFKTDRVSPSLSFYIGIPDREHFETAVRNLTALGVSKIIPVECGFCQKRWWRKKWEKHEKRLIKIMISSIKQAYIPYIPVLTPPVSFHQAIRDCGRNIIAAFQDGERSAGFLNAVDKKKEWSCFTGPPGGFSMEEVMMLKDAGASLVSISPNRLRTELAAVVLASKMIG